MEQGFVASIIGQAVEVNQGIAQIIGMEPMLIIAVVVLVSVGDLVFKIRKKFADQADLILLGACVLMSIVVSLIAIENVDTWRQVSRHALVLSGLTTLSYKVGKPLIKFLVLKKLAKLDIEEFDEIEGD